MSFWDHKKFHTALFVAFILTVLGLVPGDLGGYALLLFIALRWFAYRGVRFASVLGPMPSRQEWLWSLGIGIPAAIGTGGLSVLTLIGISYFFPKWVELAISTQGLESLTIFFSLIVLAPITEELLFRGAPISASSGKWSLNKRIWISSIVFGLLHFDLLGAALFSFALALLALRTRGLWVPIVVHFVYNIVSVWWMFTGTNITNTIPELRDDWMFAAGVAAIGAPFLYHLFRTEMRRLSSSPSPGSPASSR